MATMTFPIRELERSVRNEAKKAKDKTECVVAHSRAPHADFGTACKVAASTIALKWLLSSLVRMQDKLIALLVARDFTECREQDIRELAANLEDIAATGRTTLERLNTLGAEVRVWWSSSLVKLEEQAEYLESIAQSLQVAVDDEASTLLAVAVGEFAK
jgi:hypothetical protein